VKISVHRPLEGTPTTIRRTSTGKWFATIACAWDPTPLPPPGREVGIDGGLATFATRSDGGAIATPRFFWREERALARVQRRSQLALDAHKALRARVTERVKQAHPEMDEADLWQTVGPDVEVWRCGGVEVWRRGGVEERAAGNHRQQRRQQRRQVVARPHERTRSTG
jgi:hypothetical protein